jgi:hypothetical protein
VQQKDQLQRLLLVPEGDRVSLLDQIRSGPTRISGPAIRAAIDRLNAVRAGYHRPMKARIPPSRIGPDRASLARLRTAALIRGPTPKGGLGALSPKCACNTFQLRRFLWPVHGSQTECVVFKA